MKIELDHPLHQSFSGFWRKMRDVIAGEEAVKDAAETYLPRLASQDGRLYPDGDYRYASYKRRAAFYESTKRTLTGLVGAVMRKPIRYEFATKEFAQNFGGPEVPIEAFSAKLVREALSTGFQFVMVDASDNDPDTPYATVYYAEDVRNWVPDDTIVVLREHSRDADADALEHKTHERRRVLRLVQFPGMELTDDSDDWELDPSYWDGLDQLYIQDIHEKDGDKGWKLVNRIVPLRKGGRPMDWIPGYPLTATDISWSIDEPPLNGLANVNLSHYLNSADLEHGRHFTCLPTAWAAGFPNSDEDDPLRLGSEVAWVTEETGAKAGFLEFTGAGLGHLANGMQAKERQMAVLGARFLEQSKKSAEAAETVVLRAAGDQAVLAGVVNVVSLCLTRIANDMERWVSTNEKPTDSVTLNSDFVSHFLTPQMISQLFAAYQGGAMSFDTWFYNLERGELMRPNITAQQEQAAIEASGMNPFQDEDEESESKPDDPNKEGDDDDEDE